jgi:hypothetical protein
MKKRPFAAIINTLEAAGANVVDDTTGLYWSVMKASADADALMTFPYGKVVSYNYVASAAEVRQQVLIGASTTKETIVASTNYAIEIGNPEQDYETHRTFPKVHSFTSAATLSGSAATDRKNVYDALVAKVNAYAGNNATAYTLTYAAFTLGTDGAGTALNFTVGEQVTQETSSETANVAKCTITSGTMAGNDAAGHIWLYNISDEAAWLTTAKTLTGGTSLCVATVTNATTVHSTGMNVIDDAGYFTSKIGRGGKNYVGIKRGFSVATPTIGLAGVYAEGIGSVMLALSPSYDHSKQDLISGDLEYEFQDGDLPSAAKTYRKYILRYSDGDEDAMGGTQESALSEKILYVDESNGTNLTNFHNALAAAAVK